MPRTKIDHHARTVAAWAEWNKLSKRAYVLGLGNLVRRYQPMSIAGWAIIEESCAKLRPLVEVEAAAEGEE